MSKFLTQKVIYILSITTAVLVISTSCVSLFICKHIEDYFQEDYDYAEMTLEMNVDSIYDAIADLKKDILWDKYIVFWNDDTFLWMSYTLLGRIYLGLNEPQNALKEFYRSQQVLMQSKDYSQTEYMALEYHIGLAYKAMNENSSAYEHFQNVIDRAKELVQNDQDPSNEIAEIPSNYIIRSYAILATMDYKTEDYNEAYNKYVLVHNSLLELTHWDFASIRYDSATPYLLIFSADYAAKSAEKMGNIKYKEYYERRTNIYKFLLDYQEDSLQETYTIMTE